MNYSKIPNIIIDSENLTSNEKLVLICICRKTIGYQKDEDYISLSQFEKMSGISRPTLVKTISNLENKKILISHENGLRGCKNYSINNEQLVKILTSQDFNQLNILPEPVKNLTSTGKNFNPQKKYIKQNKEEEKEEMKSKNSNSKDLEIKELPHDFEEFSKWLQDIRGTKIKDFHFWNKKLKDNFLKKDLKTIENYEDFKTSKTSAKQTISILEELQQFKNKKMFIEQDEKIFEYIIIDFGDSKDIKSLQDNPNIKCYLSAYNNQ